MRDDTTDLLLAWGCPPRYARDYDVAHAPHAEARARVASTANWYHEHDSAVAAMVRADDPHALRSWDRDALVEVGRESGPGDDADAAEYADDVMEALEDLASAMEARR